MSNPYDQFDGPAPAAAVAPNPYDQFDAPTSPAGPVAAAPAEPSLSYGDRLDQAKAIPGALLRAADSGLRAINTGIPFSDRIEAGVKSLVGGGDYSTNLASEQAARAELSQQHPILAAGGQGIGGLLTTLALPGATPAVAGLVPALSAGARTGAAYGAAQGLSDQPDLTNAGNDIGGIAKAPPKARRWAASFLASVMAPAGLVVRSSTASRRSQSLTIGAQPRAS
jgi:hypothetical protein